MRRFTSILSLVALVASALFVSCAKPKEINPVKAFPRAKHATYAENENGQYTWTFSANDTWKSGTHWAGFRVEPAPGDTSRLWYYIDCNKAWTARILGEGQQYIQFRVGKNGYIGYDESQYNYTSSVSGDRGKHILVICVNESMIPGVGEEAFVCDLECEMEGETMPLGTITIGPRLQ